MSNTAIVDRMREGCVSFEAGDIDCMALGHQLVGLAEALEGVPRRVVDEAREWKEALAVASDPASFGELDLALEQLTAVVDRIRLWIETLYAARSN